jgi:hypothetical protein
MALCVYHETTESVQACRVCKQDVCAKCLEYGESGMCGMCLEMANARKATMEAARQARTEAAATAGTAPQPRPQPRPVPGPGQPPTGPAGKAPPKAGQAPPRPGTQPPRPQPKPAPKAGMCAEHGDQPANATCTHCQKKVCPYCLDLYDLCETCRHLPHCSRHESMVSQAKCASCKMDYCKVCLNGTDQCDRCRAIGAPKDSPAKTPTKTPSQPLKPRAKGTSELKPPPGGPPGATPAAPRTPVKPAAHIYRPPGAKGAIAPKKPAANGLPMPLVAGAGVLVLLVGLFLFSGGGKPALSDEQAVEALQTDMAYVQEAAIAYEAKNGRFPDSEEALMAQIVAKGIKPESLKLPIKLAINTPATEPYQISYRLVGDGFEVRAVDKEGRPFVVSGKDVVLTAPSRDKPD